MVVVGSGEMAEAKARLVKRAGGIPCAESEAHHARLAFVAVEDRRSAESAALRLKRAGMLVNVADRPDLCDFTLPSILEREPVLVAISTGGASAGLAKHLRLRLENLIPENIGRLAERLNESRGKLRELFPDGGNRRRSLDQALAQGGQLDVLGIRSHEQVDDWLQNTNQHVAATTTEFVLTSDDPDDLTLKQARLLGMADTILHDATIPENILVRARADARRIQLPSEPPPQGLTVILRREG